MTVACAEPHAAVHAARSHQAGAARREAARRRTLATRTRGIASRASSCVTGATVTAIDPAAHTVSRRRPALDLRLARARHGRRAAAPRLRSARRGSRPRAAVVRRRRRHPPAPRRGHALARDRRRLHRRRVRRFGRAHRERRQLSSCRSAVILEGAFGAEVGAWFDARLRRRGVRIHARHDRHVHRCASGRAARRGSPRSASWSVDHIVVGAGVSPSTEPRRRGGPRSGARRHRGRSASLRDERSRTCYAIGDVAAYESVLHGRRVRIEHWDVARAQGAHVAGEIMQPGERAVRRAAVLLRDDGRLGIPRVRRPGWRPRGVPRLRRGRRHERGVPR